MSKNYFFSISLLLFICFKSFSQSPQQDGQWGNHIPFDIVPVAISNLPDGRLIVWSSKYHDNYGGGDGFTFTQIFDPSIGLDGGVLPRTVTETNHDMFCPGINNLADGRIMATGGSSSERSSIYDPKTETWSRADDMNIPRGYQGAVTLSDGSAFTLGGSWNGGLGNKDAEIWTESTGWKLLPGIKNEVLWNSNDYRLEPQGVFRIDNHAWFWAAPNGKIFHAGPGEMMHWIDVEGEGSVEVVGKRGNDIYSINGNTVMFDIGKILKVGGSYTYDSGTPSNEKSFVIDFNNENNVTVTPTANRMEHYRTFSTSVALPNGEVLILGGMETSLIFSDVGAYFSAEIYNSETNTFRTVAEMEVPRNYHSTGILMNDGRVFIGGGGLCGDCGDVNHMDGQIYSPPYLFNQNGSLAQRPTVSAPEKAFYESELQVTASADVSEFSLVRMSSATHSVNNEQRRVPVSYTGSNGIYNLNIPGANLMPPGYYMLFAINANGVPSMSAPVLVGSDQTCLVAGASCDDANSLTVNDIADGSCNCAGTPIVCEDLTVVYAINEEEEELISEITVNKGNNLSFSLNIDGVEYIVSDPTGNELATNSIIDIDVAQAGVYSLIADLDGGAETTRAVCEKKIKVNVNSEIVPITAISVDVTTANIMVGDQLQINKVITPSNATNRIVSWLSSDESIAKVDVSGLVTIVSEGTAKITVITIDGGFIAETNIVASSANIPVSSISLDSINSSIFIGDDLSLTATVFPIDATTKKVIWSSAQPSIATVDATGKVTGLSKGFAIISATSLDGTISTTATVKVTSVSDVIMQMAPNPAEAVFYVYFASSSALELTSFNIYDSANTVVKVFTEPSSVLDGEGNYRLEISDLSIGVYTVEGVSTNGNFQSELRIARGTLVESVSLNAATASLKEGESLTLVPSVLPIAATEKSVLWTSSDDLVVTIGETGLVTAISEGTATITVTTVDGGFKSTSVITVNPAVIAVEGILLNTTAASLEIGETLPLIAEVTPTEATDKRVEWKSSDDLVASVDANGVITALSVGAVVIVATTVDGDFVALSNITVEAASVPVTGVSLATETLTLEVDATQTLVATVVPANAYNKAVAWTSSNIEVATVDAVSGLVTAVSSGTTTITVTTVDGDFEATSVVTVEAASVPVTGVSLDAAGITLEVDATQTLVATVVPANAYNKAVAWTSSNIEVATVDAVSGLVTAVSAGTTTITVTTVDGDFEATSVVTVEAASVPVTGVSLDAAAITLEVDATQTLVATVVPANADNKAVAWTSSNIEVATVDAVSGLVTAVSSGTTTITVTTVDGDFEATSVVTVEAASVPVTGVSLDAAGITLEVDATQTLVATVVPANAYNKAVAWTSSNIEVATVDAVSGLVTAVSAGTTTITATTVDGGFKSTSVITVNPAVIAVEGISLNTTAASLEIGETLPLIAEVTPTEATDKRVEWKSSDDLVASVDANGVITALSVGAVVIVATTVDGDFVALSNITVEAASVPVTGVSLDAAAITLEVDATQTLVATVVPANAYNKAVAWTSSNIEVATVDAASGLVTAVSAGTTTITVTTVDGDFEATSVVTVEAASVPVTGVSLDAAGITLEVDATQTLVATVEPANADNKAVAWTSSNIEVATVDAASGLVTAVSAGTTTITVTTVDGDFEATSVVTVEAASVPVTGVSLDAAAITLEVDATQTLVATVVPANADNKAVAWTSSNIEVATVDAASGLVTAVSAGTTTITVTTVDGDFEATSVVTVEAASVPVTGVSLDAAAITLEVDATQTLVATVVPANAYNKAVAWTSSNIEVATVDAVSGLVTAVSAGTTTITVTTVDGDFVALSNITVEAASVPVTGVSLDAAAITLEVDATQTLVATVEPVNADNKTVTWTSSNIEVATASVNGLVTALTPGVATITATTNDGSFTASTVVTVDEDTLPPSNVTVLTAPNPADAILYVVFDSEESLDITALNIYDANNNLLKTFADPSALLVDDENYRLVVTDVPVGTHILEGVSTTGSYRKEIIIEREVIAVSGVTVTPAAIIGVGQSLELEAEVSPIDATDVSVVWSISNTAIATVDQNGLVTAVSLGTATITVTTNDGSFTASTVVTVDEDTLPPSNVTVLTAPNPADAILYVVFDSEEALDITALNIYDGNNNLLKTFADPSVLLIDGENYRLEVTDVPVGTHILEGVSTTGSYRKEIIIEREVIAVTGVTVTPTATIGVGQSLELEAEVSPIEATDVSVVWSVSNPAIATVDQNGLVTAVSLGTATITVTTNDGSFTTSTVVTVDEDTLPPSNVTILTAPNPADAILYVVFDSEEALDITALNIYDGNNNLLKTFADPSALLVDGENYRLVVTDVPVGTHILEGVSTTGSYRKEIIIEREVIAVTGIIIPTTATVGVGQALELEAEVVPLEATDTRVIWASANPAIATVDQSGLVTGIGQGEVEVTASTTNGNITATTTVNVRPVVQVIGIALNYIDEVIQVDEQLAIVATITPFEATDRNVIWSSSNTDVATVDDGVVLGLEKGTTTITARTNDGDYTATATIRVEDVEMLVAPNPTTYALYVYFATSSPIEISKLIIYDSLGREVKIFNDPASILSDGNYRLLVQELPAGIYIIEGVTSNGNYQKQIIKE